MKQFRLPDPGEGLVEADIVEWKVSAGDQIQVNDTIVEVETSKSLVELPTPYAGTVSRLLVGPGETVQVGAPIVDIDDGTGSAETSSDRSATQQGQSGDDQPDDEAGSQQQEPNLVGYGPRAGATKRRARKRTQSAEEARAAVSDAFGTHQPVGHRASEPEPLTPADDQPRGAPLPGPGTPPGEPHPAPVGVLAKPPVRKLAKDLGVDLASVIGTGAAGVITRKDVTSAAQHRATSSAETPDPEPEAARTEPQRPRPEPVEGGTLAEVREPIKGVRKATAQAVAKSAFTAPHVTEWVSCDISATMDLLDRMRQRRQFAGVKVSPLLLVAKAALLALPRTREMNARWDDDAAEIIYHGSVNLGIAVATPRGLMVPNIKGADRMSLVELADAMQTMVSTAREGNAQPADLSSGTFSITNVGVFGVDGGTPILNPGESGILAVGNIDRRPWVVGGGDNERIEPRWVTTLAVSFDHRIVDGEQGSRFLSDLAGILSDPGTALLF